MEKTEEECGLKSYGIAFVRTSSRNLDVAVPLPTLNPSHTLRRATFPPGEGFVSANDYLSLHRLSCYFLHRVCEGGTGSFAGGLGAA